MQRFVSTASVLFGIIVSTVFSAEVVVAPTPYTGAFKNPLKGFRGGQEYGTVNQMYIGWNEVESAASDGVDKIISVCNQKWSGYETRNLKVAPRIWGEYPGRPNAWPSDLTPNYTSAAFIDRMKKLIAKLGQAWNNDPRVAWVQTGIEGPWGEQAQFEQGGSFYLSPFQTAMCQAYHDVFPNKLLVYRHATTCTHQDGVYWDSWGCGGQAFWYTNMGDQWKKPNVMEGEISYDYCPPVHTSPTEDVADTIGVTKLCEIARWFHSQAVGWISGYAVGASTARGAAMLQQTLGYRFVIDTVRYSGSVAPGESLSVSFGVTNIGAAQFIYPWPVEVSLCNPSTKQPVWKATVPNLDIRQWLPGDKWDYDAQNNQYKTHKYLVPPVKNRVSAKFAIAASMAAGEYVLALAILDPAGMLPCARFAIANYWNGGRHPIGKVGVGVTVANPQLDASQFNDLKADNSLHYSLTGPTSIGGARSVSQSRAPFVWQQTQAGLKFSVPAAGDFEAQLMELDGRVVASAQGVAAPAERVRMAGPRSGIYLLSVKTSAGASLQKIVMR